MERIGFLLEKIKLDRIYKIIRISFSRLSGRKPGIAIACGENIGIAFIYSVLTYATTYGCIVTCYYDLSFSVDKRL